MSAPITLANMLLAVQRRANIEGQSGFVTLPEQRERINYACADIYDKLVSARSQEFYRTTSTITTVANTSSYTLPANFYQLTSVDVALGNNQTLSARPYMEAERNRFKWYPGWNYQEPIYYRLLAGSINFTPAPNGAFVITLNYYPTFTLFATDGSQDSSTFDGVNGWEEAVIWRVVSEIKDKGEEDPSYAWQRYMDVVKRIEGLAAMRDAGTAERVHDVYSDFDAWGGR